VRGGQNETQFNSDMVYFMGTTTLAAVDGAVDIYVTAKAEGKAESDPVIVKARYRPSVEHLRSDAFEVIVGSDSQGHFVSELGDFTGSNLLKDEQIKSLTNRITTRTDWLKKNLPDTELIYFIIPTCMSVYPETVPTQYKQNTSDVSRKNQFIGAVKAGGATVIDVTETLIAHKSDGLKLFHKTDSHWTEYGAWVAYTDLMNYIAEKFPDAAPRTFNDMGFYEKDVEGGDMPYYLDFDYSRAREVAVFADPIIDMPRRTLKFVDDSSLLMNHNTTPLYADIKTNRANLPSAYVCRDSYSIALYDMLCERFDRTVYRDMWNYDFDTEALTQIKPDYMIYIISERNLGDVLF
jgi:hypothetical protein